MNYFKFFFITISLSLVSLSAWGNNLRSPNLTINSKKGDCIVATVKFPAPMTGDLYLATKINAIWYFIGTDQKLSLTPKPYQANSLFILDITAINMSSEDAIPGSYELYQVVTPPGEDPLLMKNWIGGLEGLSILTFTIN